MQLQRTVSRQLSERDSALATLRARPDWMAVTETVDRYLRDLGIGEPGTRLALVAEIFLRASCNWQANRMEDLTDLALRQTHWVLSERVRGPEMSRKRRSARDIAQTLLLIALAPCPTPAEFANGQEHTTAQWPNDPVIATPCKAPLEMRAKPFEYVYRRGGDRQNLSVGGPAVVYGPVLSPSNS